MVLKRRFWGITSALVLVGLTYPLCVLFKLGAEDGTRWIQNDPAFNFFLPFVFSLAVGIFLQKADCRPLLTISRPQKALSALILAVLVVLAAYAVWDSVKRPLLEPFLFQDHGSALDCEKQLRTEAASGDTDARLMYAQQHPGFGGFRGLWERGSFCAWLALFLNSVAAAFLALFFWYLANLILFRNLLGHQPHEWIAVVTGLLVIWFPCRLYSEWYIGLYSLELRSAFWFLALVAFFAYVFCVLQLSKSIGIKVFTAIPAGLSALVGLLSKILPQELGNVARFIEGFGFGWYVACMTLIVVSIFVIVLGFSQDSADGPAGKPRMARVKPRRRTRTRRRP